jgi:hypothetical protein
MGNNVLDPTVDHSPFKTYVHINGRGCVDGREQREYLGKDKTS